MTGAQSSSSIAAFWDHCMKLDEWRDHPCLHRPSIPKERFMWRNQFFFAFPPSTNLYRMVFWQLQVCYQLHCMLMELSSMPIVNIWFGQWRPFSVRDMFGMRSSLVCAYHISCYKTSKMMFTRKWLTFWPGRSAAPPKASGHRMGLSERL